MNRQPVYHEQSRDLRVISAPNGLWLAQQRIGSGSDKTFSGWQDVSRATSRDEAIRRIYTIKPKQV